MSDMLDGGRLATIVGPGGAGKTRLATEAARRCESDFPDGVWLVELAPVSDAATISQATLGALGLLDTVVDVVPVPQGDAHGVGLAAGSLPMIIAGLVLGAAAALSLRGRWTVLVTVVGGAVAIGLSFAGVLAWLGVSGGNYLAEASAISLAVATAPCCGPPRTSPRRRWRSRCGCCSVGRCWVQGPR